MNQQYKDISFWIPYTQLEGQKWIKEYQFINLVREIGGNWVEAVILKDTFTHPKTMVMSRMYRILYSPTDSDLNDHAKIIINGFQDNILAKIHELGVKLH